MRVAVYLHTELSNQKYARSTIWRLVPHDLGANETRQNLPGEFPNDGTGFRSRTVRSMPSPMLRLKECLNGMRTICVVHFLTNAPTTTGLHVARGVWRPAEMDFALHSASQGHRCAMPQHL